MKKTLLILLLLQAASNAQSQDDVAYPISRSEFIIGAGLSNGASLLSLDFEKLVFLKPDRLLAIGVGFGFNQEFRIFSSPEGPTNYFNLPHHICINFGKRKSFLELGLGGTWLSGDGNNYYLAYPMLGYRYHPFRNPGFSFKAWLYYPFGQPFITDYEEIIFSPLGLSFGIAL